MQAAHESMWTTTLRNTKEEPKMKKTKSKIKKMKSKDLQTDAEGSTPIHEIVEDVIRYMKKKEKVVSKINEKKATKLSDSREIEDLKKRVGEIESSMTSKFSQIEQNMNILKGLFDDMKRSNEVKNEKWETELNHFMVKMETKSEKEKNKFISTMQRLHEEHNNDKKITDDKVKQVEDSIKKTNKSIGNGMRKILDDTQRTKDDVDIL